MHSFAQTNNSVTTSVDAIIKSAFIATFTVFDIELSKAIHSIKDEIITIIKISIKPDLIIVNSSKNTFFKKEIKDSKFMFPLEASSVAS